MIVAKNLTYILSIKQTYDSSQPIDNYDLWELMYTVAKCIDGCPNYIATGFTERSFKVNSQESWVKSEESNSENASAKMK